MPSPAHLLQQLSQAFGELQRERDFWRNRAVGLGADRNEFGPLGEPLGEPVRARGPVRGSEVPVVPGSSTVLRQLIYEMQGGFTIRELAHAAQRDVKEVKKVVDAMIAQNSLESAGSFRGQAMFVFRKPSEMPSPDVAPPAKGAPFDRLPPVGVESRATGEPVRIRSGRKVRKQMSGSMAARRVLIRNEAAYQRQKEAVEKRMLEQASKAQKEPKWKRKK